MKKFINFLINSSYSFFILEGSLFILLILMGLIMGVIIGLLNL